MVTEAPRSSSASATAAPMPRPLPVTRAWRPARPVSVGSAISALQQFGRDFLRSHAAAGGGHLAFTFEVALELQLAGVVLQRPADIGVSQLGCFVQGPRGRRR